MWSLDKKWDFQDCFEKYSQNKRLTTIENSEVMEDYL